jgi:hypothetical protein
MKMKSEQDYCDICMTVNPGGLKEVGGRVLCPVCRELPPYNLEND